MEFCPKCGKLLMPEKKDSKIQLICKACGYHKAANEVKGYDVVHHVDEGKRRKTLVVDEAHTKGNKRREEEHELIADNFEIYESTGEEGEGEEEPSEENEFE